MQQASRSDRAALVLLAALVGLPDLATAGAGVAEWLPFHVGERRLYRVHRDRVIARVNGESERVFHVGRTLEEVGEPRLQDGKPAFVIRRETTRPEWEPGNSDYDTSSQLVSVDERGALLHGTEWLVGSLHGPLRLVNQPPARMLPAAPEVGLRWTVGVIRHPEFELDLAGEAVALEEVRVGETTLRDCLRVRYSGPLTGEVETGSGRSRAEAGRYEQSVWFQRGIGMVREETEWSFETTLPEVGRVRISEQVRTHLEQAARPR